MSKTTYDPVKIRYELNVTLNTFLFESMKEQDPEKTIPYSLLGACSRIFGFFNYYFYDLLGSKPIDAAIDSLIAATNERKAKISYYLEEDYPEVIPGLFDSLYDFKVPAFSYSTLLLSTTQNELKLLKSPSLQETEEKRSDQGKNTLLTLEKAKQDLKDQAEKVAEREERYEKLLWEYNSDDHKQYCLDHPNHKYPTSNYKHSVPYSVKAFEAFLDNLLQKIHDWEKAYRQRVKELEDIKELRNKLYEVYWQHPIRWLIDSEWVRKVEEAKPEGERAITLGEEAIKEAAKQIEELIKLRTKLYKIYYWNDKFEVKNMFYKEDTYYYLSPDIQKVIDFYEKRKAEYQQDVATAKQIYQLSQKNLEQAQKKLADLKQAYDQNYPRAWVTAAYRKERDACYKFLRSLRGAQAALVEDPLKEEECTKRTFADMVKEMELELGNLPRFIANTKVVKEENGQQAVAKHKIKTYNLPEAKAPAKTQTIQDEIIQRTHVLYGKKRVEIEEEIRARQVAWRTDSIGQELPQKTKQRLPRVSPQKEPEPKDLSPEPPPQWSR